METIMPPRAISSLNCANPSCTLELILKREIKRRLTSKGGICTQKNRDYVHTLQDAGLIPYTDASEDNFVDVVDNDQELYTPQLLNEEEE